MNYIWDLIIKAEQSGIEKQYIRFVPAKVYSPYMELSNELINTRVIEQKVEINPYYRFYDIFRDLFDANNNDDIELRDTLFDIIIHFLADIDLIQGMNKREYYIKFVLRDIERGLLGNSVREKIRRFNREEREVLAHNILRLYETGEALYLFRDTMRKIFKSCIIYANCEEKDELLIYIGQEENETTQAKLELIQEIFLPVRFHTEIYWKNHFGIIGVAETMRMDNIALY
ncbi:MULTISPECIES: hypothetical protein [Aneurinibacillus]|uniref:Iron-dependent peroxidase n=1 Tax=Aneurinibacillus thermoaerophilus TaxID=143495 RepID=A0A1G8ACP3_ANETH|nr:MULTISPECIES: hypothetical protein [Aneurinibacillus]AMA73485.1 iron-dependent peroxidase [Aneurinibacillus sp. XH2]MED0738486.1 iron-dependent peroxidase [Aneurinibacillus thermoaerophilus]MED0756128.1 iron-dependent peroxidase [Aneurinibacillus thermoaerophilus]MED0762272.1 iron-dependent peroxidase [Aneurinibacillus thermoaerophilus]QYY43940.1 iron-dependent peroxidase [Aneurinibacillus thermoaerophilus]